MASIRETVDEVPDEMLDELRSICLGLPETYEEQAWIGTRWMVRKKTFAHAFTVPPGSTAAYARAAATDEAVTVVTFRAAGPDLEMIRASGHPYFYAGWGRDVVGIVLNESTDWSEITELLTESYCVLAPQKLIKLVDRPPD